MALPFVGAVVGSKVAEGAFTTVKDNFAVLVLLPFVLVSTLFGMIAFSIASAGVANATATTSCSAGMGNGTYVPNDGQSANMTIVQIIYQVGMNRGMTDTQIMTAMAVSIAENRPNGPLNSASRAIPESLNFPNDRVVPGDHDSVGVFQQRATKGGWDGKPYGTVEQLMDPAYSAGRFFDGVKIRDKNNDMGMAELGWDVQRAADAYGYRALLNSYTPTVQQWLRDARTNASSTALSPNTPQSTGGTWVKPVIGNWVITSPFGPRNTGIKGASTDHKGLDIDLETGDPVVAATDGVVIQAGPGNGYGNYITVNNGLNEDKQAVSTRYAHLDSIGVKVGDLVKRGQELGKGGNTGVSGGSHLHFEVIIDGKPTNPEPYLALMGAISLDEVTEGSAGSTGAVCSPVTGDLSDPGAGPRDPAHENLSPRAWNVKQVTESRWGCNTNPGLTPCTAGYGGYDPDHGSSTSDHRTGNALDITIGKIGKQPDAAQKAQGDQIAAFYKDNAAQVGVSYVIWYGQIWSVSRSDEGWRAYNGGGVYDPNNVTGGHYDHVHVSVAS